MCACVHACALSCVCVCSYRIAQLRRARHGRRQLRRRHKANQRLHSDNKRERQRWRSACQPREQTQAHASMRRNARPLRAARLEGGQRKRHLRLVVPILRAHTFCVSARCRQCVFICQPYACACLVNVRPLCEEPLRQRLVRVRLDGQRGGHGQHLRGAGGGEREKTHVSGVFESCAACEGAAQRQPSACAWPPRAARVRIACACGAKQRAHGERGSAHARAHAPRALSRNGRSAPQRAATRSPSRAAGASASHAFSVCPLPARAHRRRGRRRVSSGGAWSAFLRVAPPSRRGLVCVKKTQTKEQEHKRHAARAPASVAGPLGCVPSHSSA